MSNQATGHLKYIAGRGVFKVENNSIRLVESVFASMPYKMPSVW